MACWIQALHSMRAFEQDGISAQLTAPMCQSARPARCSRCFWELQGTSSLVAEQSLALNNCTRRSVVHLGVSRERGGDVETFKVQRQLTSNGLGCSGAERRMRIDNLMLAASSSSLEQQQQQQLLPARVKSTLRR